MKRTATAQWSGGLKDGKGTLSTESGAMKETPYGFRNRFEDVPGTTPEELIAAAHAGCFTMALSGALERAGLPPTSITTKAIVTMIPVDGKPTVTGSHLELVAKVPGADAAKFAEIAEGAKSGCIISRLLNTEITMDAKLDL